MWPFIQGNQVSITEHRVDNRHVPRSLQDLKIHVVTLHWNQRRLTENAADSLGPSSRGSALRFELCHAFAAENVGQAVVSFVTGILENLS